MYLFIYYSYTFLPRIVSSNKLLLMMVRLFLRNTYKGTDENKNGSHSCSCCKKNEWKPTSTVISNFHHRRPLKIFVISWMFYLIHWYFYSQSPKWVIYTWSHVFLGNSKVGVRYYESNNLAWIQFPQHLSIIPTDFCLTGMSRIPFFLTVETKLWPWKILAYYILIDFFS